MDITIKDIIDFMTRDNLPNYARHYLLELIIRFFGKNLRQQSDENNKKHLRKIIIDIMEIKIHFLEEYPINEAFFESCIKNKTEEATEWHQQALKAFESLKESSDIVAFANEN